MEQAFCLDDKYMYLHHYACRPQHPSQEIVAHPAQRIHRRTLE